MEHKPFYSSVINALSTSRRFEGGLILNMLGYHLVRMIAFRILFLMRRKRAPRIPAAREVFERIERDGFVVLPNFFPEDVFNEIRDECYRLEMKVHNPVVPRMLKGTKGQGETENSVVLKNHLGENAIIKEVVSAVLRKDILIDPGIEFDRSFVPSESLGAASTETADNLHFDISFPTVKCFYYINKITKDNAAHCYVRGSHKLTISRMLMEHKMSVAFWRWSKEMRETVTPEVGQEFLDAQNMHVESVEGEPNTLVIVNTMGFHKRGDFKTTTPREMVYVNYRTLDTLSYMKKQIFNLVRSRQA